MDLTQAKDIATIAAPLVKVLVDEFISPKVKLLLKKKGVSIKMTAHAFENQFESYLIESYKKYSTPNILVLDNQQRKLKDIYIPLEVVSKSRGEERHIIENFEEDFIPRHKKVLIIDTAGMGKSTISKRLFLAVVEQHVGVPILIELRRLKKDKKMIDEILRQLSMINEKADEDFVLELIRKGGFVFMLDGFDEIEHEERKVVLEDVRNFIDKAGKNYFLLTSRPEDALGAFGDFMSFDIRSLEPEEAYELLRKYDNCGEVSTLLIQKLTEKENENVNEFLENPLLVSLLYAAFEHKHTIPLKKHMFYRQVYDAFFERHDLTKGDSFIRNKFTRLESDDFHRVLRYIGYRSMTIDKIEFSKDELIKIIEQAKAFCVDLKFAPSDFLKDLLTKVPLFVEDGLYIKWAHKSIQEYFAANFIYHDSKDKQGAILHAIAKDNGYRYYNVLDIYYSIDFKSFRRHIIYNLLRNYINMLDEVRVIWPSISAEIASNLFIYKYVVTKLGFTDNIDEEYSRLMEEVEAYAGGSDEWEILGNFLEEQDAELSFVKVLEATKIYSVVYELMVSKQLDFLETWDARRLVKDSKREVYDLKPTSDYSDLNVKTGEYHLLDGSNADSFFRELDLDSFMKSFTFYSEYIDERRARAIIKEIEDEIIEEQSDDFLMAGL